MNEKEMDTNNERTQGRTERTAYMNNKMEERRDKRRSDRD